MNILNCEPVEDGWHILFSLDEGKAAAVHLTQTWLDDMWRHQIKPRQTEDAPADGEAEWNQLAAAVKTQADAATIGACFAAAYQKVVLNRRARAAAGLKAVTRDGDEDLRAVLAGAPVRPWNATRRTPELHEWMRQKNREARENR